MFVCICYYLCDIFGKQEVVNKNLKLQEKVTKLMEDTVTVCLIEFYNTVFPKFIYFIK